jgi:uncharacterized protein YdiU (UPF0061 family)
MWEHPQFRYDFVDQLPGDPSDVNRPRPVTKACYSFVKPTPVKSPSFYGWSHALSAQLGLPSPDAHALELLAGNRVTPGMRPYALCYGGHQFGHWAGQLGDGRAICLGEWRDPQGNSWELQLKGAGRTPYSRQGDGRAVLRSSIREFLCSEAMHHLGIPTTRALSLVHTEDQVLRDMFYDGRPEYETAALVTRVAPSFLRFGNFEILAQRGEYELLKQLADFVIRRYYQEFDGRDPQVYVQWFHEICRRTALMIAHWQRVGFVHGVMNTDNMSILGLTIDYGPYGWLDVYDPNWTPNTTDAQHRRYRYAHQPSIAHWNLSRLAAALLSLFPHEATIEAGLEIYRQSFTQTFLEFMGSKLGLQSLQDEDGKRLYLDLETLLTTSEVDMTLFFRRLTDLSLKPETPPLDQLGLLRQAFYQAELSAPQETAWITWIERWLARARVEGLKPEQRTAKMGLANPHYVLRNYLSQEAIDGAERGDTGKIQTLLEHLANKRPEWARHKPGCSALSCSS